MQPAIDLYCDVASPSGYSAHARNLIKSLLKFADLKIIDRKHDLASVVLDEEIEHALIRSNGKTREPQVNVFFETPEFYRPKPGVLNVGFVQWETTRIPDTDMNGKKENNWVSQMNRMDAIWTSCTFARSVFKNCGVTKPIAVFHGPIDTDFYRHGLEEIMIEDLVVVDDEVIPREKRPVAIGMMAQWTRRKNIDAFLVPLLSRFKRDEVTLVLKTYASNVDSSHEREKIIDQVRSVRKTVGNENAPKVIVMPDKMTDEEIAAWFSSIDIYLNTSRGEGFCMPLVQAMASKCLVVSNGFSAPYDYVRPAHVIYDQEDETYSVAEVEGSNGFLINYSLSPAVGMNTPWYRCDQDWGDIDQGSMLKTLKTLVLHKPNQGPFLQGIRDNARKSIVESMSIPVAAHALSTMIDRMLAGDPIDGLVGQDEAVRQA